MRGLLLLVFIVSVSGIVSACKQTEETAEKVVDESEQTHKEAEEEMAKSAPPQIAADLWKLLQTENYRQHWKMWPGREAFYEGTSPHGALLTTYVNDPAYSALEAGEKQLPPGSIIVTENYTPEKNLTDITVMYKLAGFDAQNNNWFWAKFMPDGIPVEEDPDGEQAELAGKVDSCIACHSENKDNDYIMSDSLASE